MRLVTYETGGGPRAGVLLADGSIADAWSELGGDPPVPSVRALLARGRLPELASQLEGGLRTNAAAPGSVALRPPLPHPDKIICIGLNYYDHAAEVGLEPPETPTFFAKFRNALVGDGATVQLPSKSEKVDYEAEVAFVVGRLARDVEEADALEYVAGYTLLNDLSARDLQFATPQWMPGKVFDGSAPCGPALVTADEVDPKGIELALTLNGEQRQSATTAELIFGVAPLLAHLSALMTLAPGDLVSMGSPAGVGSARQPRSWLQDGDQLTISSPQLGELRTHIAR